jgi:hypothetical protein
MRANITFLLLFYNPNYIKVFLFVRSIMLITYNKLFMFSKNDEFFR